MHAALHACSPPPRHPPHTTQPSFPRTTHTHTRVHTRTIVLPQVLVAVGGATYTNWARMNTGAIAKFVQEFGLDGVDIDYEVRLRVRPNCISRGGCK